MAKPVTRQVLFLDAQILHAARRPVADYVGVLSSRRFEWIDGEPKPQQLHMSDRFFKISGLSPLGGPNPALSSSNGANIFCAIRAS